MTAFEQQLARRTFLRRTGIGSIALGSLLSRDFANTSVAGSLDSQTTATGLGGVLASTHHPPRVKRVIHLCMAGGPAI